MKMDGQFAFDRAAPVEVWAFLTDANRIAECLPGCQKLTPTGEDTFEMEMRFGVGPISGLFHGSIRLHDLVPTSEYKMTVEGKGTPGFVKGDGTIQVTEGSNGTLLRYTGDVSAGGPIASVGQRMIGSAARMIIDQFFKCVAGKLNAH